MLPLEESRKIPVKKTWKEQKKGIGKEIQDQRKNREQPLHNSVNISKNTQKSTEDVRKLSLTQSLKTTFAITICNCNDATH